MKRPASRDEQLGLVAVRRVSAFRDHEQAGFRQSARDRRGSARACRTRRPRPAPRAPGRDASSISASMFQSRNAGSQPDVVPAAEGRVGVGVVAREALAQVGGLVGRARRLDARDRDVLDEQVRRDRDHAGHVGWRAACSSAIEPPSLWPNSQGRSMPSAANSAGSTSSACACMKSGGQRSSGGLGVERP